MASSVAGGDKAGLPDGLADFGKATYDESEAVADAAQAATDGDPAAVVDKINALCTGG